MNIFRDRAGLGASLSIVVALLACSFSAPLSALSRERSMTQYVHATWGVDRGYAGGRVYSVARSRDGYLWLGTEGGLIRFDGSKFDRIEMPLDNHQAADSVRGLAEDIEGNLWIRLDGPRLLRYRDGQFENAMLKFDLHEATFTAMALSEDGHLLIWGPQNKTMTFRSGHFLYLQPDDIIGTMVAMTETMGGVLWLGARDGVYKVKNSTPVRVLPDSRRQGISALVPSEHGGVWVGSEGGLQLWEDGHSVPLKLPDRLRRAQVFALTADHEHNLWVGTDAGLYRVDTQLEIVTGIYRNEKDPAVTSVYEDTDGSIWFAGLHSLEQLRDGMFATFASKDSADGNSGGSLFVDETGRVWLGPALGGLFQIEHGISHRVTLPGNNNDIVYSIDGTKDEIWLGRQEGGLTSMVHRGDRWLSHTYTRGDGLAQNSVYTVTRARDGTVWAGTVSGGISRMQGGRFKTFNADNVLQSNAIFSSLETADRKLWFASASGLVCFNGIHWETYDKTDRGTLPNPRVLFEDSDHVLWVGTAYGLARFEDGRIRLPPLSLRLLTKEVLSIGEDAQGSLWVVTSDQVLQVDREKLLKGTLTDADVLSYGLDDGLIETQGVRRDRSLMSDAAGRIWLSMAHSLAVADPTAARSYQVPVHVRIDSVLLDGLESARSSGLKLPDGTHSITFKFSGSDLGTSQRTQFRHMLQGLDKTWTNDSSLKQVVYGHLAPGAYTFRIIASNAMGVWNGPETSFTFEVLPAFWQTLYFRVLSAILIVALAIAAYRFRLMQVTGRLNRRFQDRLAERTRIAQDLHDTLLQGVISASMQLDVAHDQLPADSPARPMLERILKLMRHVNDEGREALRGLRTIDNSESIETALKRLTAEFTPSATSGVFIYVQGAMRALKVPVFDEVYRIGREAYLNAVAHAAASRIEITVEYGSRNFRLHVSDDGCGIDAGVLKNGRQGHWGLAGMRERAEAVGSSLSIRTRTPGGTDVEFSAPAAIAYTALRPRGFRWPWQPRRHYSETKEDTKFIP